MILRMFMCFPYPVFLSSNPGRRPHPPVVLSRRA
jgi:hypothetical protein